jgi:hypothetical protein
VITVANGAVLDHEASGSHVVAVKVTDSAGHERVEKFEIQVGDVNEVITSLTFEGGKVAENAAAGTVVGQASATDPDQNETLKYALDYDADGRFLIDAATGVITVADGAVLDHEAVSTHLVAVKVTDSAGHERVEKFEIQVGDVNEEIESMWFSGDLVLENSAPGAVVGQAFATDLDADDSFHFALSNDADGRFVIDPVTGIVSVADGAVLDFEQATSHQITICVVDSAGHSREISQTIQLKNTADTPDEQSTSDSIQPLTTNPLSPDETRRSTSEQPDSPASEPTSHEDSNSETTATDIQFVPLGDLSGDEQITSVDWSRVEFGDIAPINELPDAPYEQPAVASPDLGNTIADDASPEAAPELVASGIATVEAGFLAKLWGYARAYRGASSMDESERKRRNR